MTTVISAPEDFNEAELHVDPRPTFGRPLHLKCESFSARDRSRLRVVLVALVAGWSVLVAGCAAPAPLAPGPGPVPLPVPAPPPPPTGVDAAVGHLSELQRIAGENGGNRGALSPGYDASVEYVARELRELGYEVATPSFEFLGLIGVDLRLAEGVQRNVIAQTRTGDPNRVVVLGAHLDSVPEGPGLNDNGSGVALLLELARQLAADGPTRNAVRFAFWGAEEQGLVGSTAYVEGLSRQERSRMSLYLNVDMVGSPNPGYFVQGGAGSGVASTGPRGSAEVRRVLAGQFEAVGITPERVAFREDSDYLPFLKAGVPSGGLSTGAGTAKTAGQVTKWGGKAGRPYDPCYHLACDDLDNVDRTALDRFLRATGGAVRHFAMLGEGVPPAR